MTDHPNSPAMTDELRKALEAGLSAIRNDASKVTERGRRIADMRQTLIAVAECAGEMLEALAASSPPSRSAPDHVLVPREATSAMLSAWYAEKARSGSDNAAYCAMLAAAPPAPSSAGDEGVVERPLLLTWYNAQADVVATAWEAADDSSDDFDPDTHVAVPNDSFQALSDALEALEALVPEGHPYVGVGALNDEVRAALSASSSALIPDADRLAADLRAEGYWQRTITLRDDGGYEDEHLTKTGVEMRALAQSTPAIRDQAFEEAAAIARRYKEQPNEWDSAADAAERIETDIRALKGTSPGDQA